MEKLLVKAVNLSLQDEIIIQSIVASKQHNLQQLVEKDQNTRKATER